MGSFVFVAGICSWRPEIAKNGKAPRLSAAPENRRLEHHAHHFEDLLFSDPHFQWRRKIIICVAFFSPNSAKTPLCTTSLHLVSHLSLHTEMGIISKVKMGLRSKGKKI